MQSSRLAWIAVVAGFTLAACGGDPPPPPAPPTPPMPAKVEPPPPVVAPEPSAAASAAPAAKPQASGRPPVLFSNATEVSETFGTSPGAKVEIGDDKGRAVFRVPENALHQGYNITFKLDPRGKSTGPAVGKIYHITPVAPPDPAPVKIENTETPFSFEMSTGGKKDVNLAIGVVEGNKITWQIIAPRHVDDGAGIAFFNVPILADEYVHLTTKPASSK